MKDINKCNIIYDLLPTYVDDLASEDTKEIIEDHIKTCNKCKQDLEFMSSTVLNKKQYEKITKEQIEKDMRLINVLKKIKRRNRLMILISIISVIVFFSLGIYFYNQFKVQETNSNRLLYPYGNNIAQYMI